jgi:RimJ/RimL family protein N-acetyltransferase
MNFDEPPKIEQETFEIRNLCDFDMEYFKQLEGQDGWIALGQENCTNQQYFTAVGGNHEKLGIIGVYDAADEKNVIHTVVDPKYRGHGLAAKFKMQLMEKLNLPFITMTINIDNIASIKATEKISGVKKISDEQYELEFHKVKYIYEK